MSSIPEDPDAAKAFAEQRLKDAGWRFSSNNAEGGRVYRFGPYALAIPSRGWSDKKVRSGVLKDIHVKIGQANRWAATHKDGRGQRPADVDGWAPLGPPGPAAGAAFTDAQDQAQIEHALRTVDSPAGSVGDARPVLKVVKPTEEVSVPVPRGRKLTFQQCPVSGCPKPASGKHLRAHKDRGELAKDYKLPSRVEGIQLLSAKATMVTAAPKRESKRRADGEVGGVVAAPGSPFPELVKRLGRLNTDLLTLMDGLKTALEEVTRTVQEVAQLAANKERENELLRQDLSKLQSTVDQMEQSFTALRSR